MRTLSLPEFCREFKALAGSRAATEEKIARGRECMAGLLQDEACLMEALSTAAASRTPEAFLPADINGITIYRDPERTFSLYLFIWEPYTPYPIHDHGSWGVVGCYRGRIRETKWQLINRIDRHMVELSVRAAGEITRGGTTAVRALEEGLHSVQAMDGRLALSIHAYGAPVRKGPLQLYHPVPEQPGQFTVHPGYPLYTYRRLLALEALTELEQDWAEAVIERVAAEGNSPLPEAARRFRQS